MQHGYLTLAIPFAPAQIERVNRNLVAINPPARRAFGKIDDADSLVHFMSINAIPVLDGQAQLIMEASVDGEEIAALRHIVATIGHELGELLATAGLTVPPPDLLSFLTRHRLKFGAGWFTTPGVPFSGVPGLSVGRIRQEAALAAAVGPLLAQHRAPASALSKLEFVRSWVFSNASLKWALIAQPVPLLADAPSGGGWRCALSLMKTLLWPLALLPMLVIALPYSWLPPLPFGKPTGALITLVIEFVVVLIGILLLALRLRLDERRDCPLDVEPDSALVSKIMNRENHVAQNHLASVADLKPGRLLILRLVFWAVGAVASFTSRPGFLSGIGTIHFARWLVLPGANKLLFFSNYDGSWNSYLEDFIVRAHQGLTAIWSNVRNFPKTRWLVIGGASDGARFKRIARRQQQPSYFWYSAYPHLTMSQIRTNAAIRHGIARITTEAEAARWLEMFGQYTHSHSPLRDSYEIPTLVFGGIPRLRFSHCLIIQLAGELSQRKRWLSEIAPLLCYGELDPAIPVALAAGISATGLSALGLDAEALATFPTAFQQGMTPDSRARTLGDEGRNSHQFWWWGRHAAQSDLVLIVYARDEQTLSVAVDDQLQWLRQCNQHLVYQLPLAPLPPRGEPVREPFGFVDGISQPIMRGGRSKSPADSIHTVEPGEFVLGHVNNSGYTAPTPRFRGTDIGRNGTYLVVRQMEQDTSAFEDYLRDTAVALQSQVQSFGLGAEVSCEWLAAKMVGRWRLDGSPLVEHPMAPKSISQPPPTPDNDFLYGKVDLHGLRCPLGAHIRRANPRDSFAAGSKVQMGISNRHRIRRVGRSYRPGVDGYSANAGLLFMCINADIETQFEFLQQTWLLGRTFSGLNDEADPLLGHSSMSIQTTRGPLTLKNLSQFVTVRGGGYFFMPSKSAMSTLCES